MRIRIAKLQVPRLGLLVAALAVAGCATPGDDASPTSAAAPAAAPASSTSAVEPAAAPAPGGAGKSARSPDEQEQAAMLEILSAETAPDRKAWLTVTPGNPETQALARSLAEIFERGGWKVETQTLSGMGLKPGVSMLIADEQPPGWAESALRALQASGVDVKSAIGYRPYFEEKKRENPNWAGITLASDQVFVIAVGPEPKG